MHDSVDGPVAAIAPGLVEFTVLARELHMTAAAERLEMPQPTLSRHLARLERELGVALLIRSGRRMRLTPEGQVLRDSVEQALGELGRGVQRVLLDVDPGRGRVDLGFMHTLGPVVVPRLIQEFRELRPGIRFELHQEGHETLLARLRAGIIDVCLTSPMPEDPELATRPLCEQELVCLLPRGHALAGRRALRLAELAGEPFVGLKPGYGIRRITDEWCGRAGFAPRLMFQGDDIDTVRGLVAAGLGVALLPREPGRLPSGTVEVAVTPRASRTIGVVWARTVPETPPVALFRTFLLERGSALLRD
ncbi:LysR family transcriptional regulator [Blastococcus sp. SYSU DS0619]